MLSLIGAKYLQEYQLEIEFSDKRKGIVDLKTMIFQPAPEYLYFKQKFKEWGYAA